MKSYSRKHPEFSLCGLNCVLCPQFYTEGKSQCPGCGGEQFYEKHPTCSIITCSGKHNVFEFCFECSEFPCNKYEGPKEHDSFISKTNFMQNMNEANNDINLYLEELKEKQKILEHLLNYDNDGRMKRFFCLAVNMLQVDELKDIMISVQLIEEKTNDVKVRSKRIKEIFEEEAEKKGIALKLRK